MNRDDIQRLADEASALAETDFANAETRLLGLQPAAREADRQDEEGERFCAAIVLDSLATIHARKAGDYWIRLVDVLGGPEAIGTCWTGESFADYCGDRSRLGLSSCA